MVKFTFEQISEEIPHLGTLELARLREKINREADKRIKEMEKENEQKN